MPKNKKSLKNDCNCYGTTTIGTKGQIVIPSEARKKYKLKEGEKLIVFGSKKGVITLVKPDSLKKLTKFIL